MYHLCLLNIKGKRSRGKPSTVWQDNIIEAARKRVEPYNRRRQERGMPVLKPQHLDGGRTREKRKYKNYFESNAAGNNFRPVGMLIV